jgi:hypothetical protein
MDETGHRGRQQVSETGTKAAELLIPFVECEQDLEAEIGARYGSPDVHPAMQRRYERDMETIERSRAARTRLLAYIFELEADRERLDALERVSGWHNPSDGYVMLHLGAYKDMVDKSIRQMADKLLAQPTASTNAE